MTTPHMKKNKGKAIADQIEYDSIDKPATAKYVFEFINFLRHRSSNNAITTFSRLQDIEDSLRRQWSGLLQHLLLERRTRTLDRRRIEDLTDQFENLKAAILAAVGSKDEKQIARGVVRYRKLYDFVAAIDQARHVSILSGPPMSWPEFLHTLEITGIADASIGLTGVIGDVMGRGPTQILNKADGTFYITFRPFDMNSLQDEWDAFMAIRQESRAVIVDALTEMRSGGPMMMRRYVRYIPQTVDAFITEQKSRGSVQEGPGEHPE